MEELQERLARIDHAKTGMVGQQLPIYPAFKFPLTLIDADWNTRISKCTGRPWRERVCFSFLLLRIDILALIHVVKNITRTSIRCQIPRERW
jgi:hypothetical protein